MWIMIRTLVGKVGGEFKLGLFLFTDSFDTSPGKLPLQALGFRRQLAAAHAATLKPGH